MVLTACIVCAVLSPRSAYPAESLTEDQAPRQSSLVDKINTAQRDAFELYKTFRSIKDRLTEKEKELQKLSALTKKKKTKDMQAKIKELKKDVALLTEEKNDYADKSLVYAWDKKTDRLRTIYFQEPVRKNPSRKSGKKQPIKTASELSRSFPTYPSNDAAICSVLQYSGNGHGMNLLAICNGRMMPVLALVHFHDDEKGLIKNIQHVYTPYSVQIHDSALVEKGKEYLRTTVADALVNLEKKHVPSRAFHGEYVLQRREQKTEISFSDFLPAFIPLMIVNEHMDEREFRAASEESASSVWTLVEKEFVILGANGERAYTFSFSSMMACCMAQFIESTYRENVLGNYHPEANLEKDFIKGMHDHQNAVEAMVLLFDFIVSMFSESAKKICMASPEILQDCIAVAYNGGVYRLNAVIERYGETWDKQKSVPRGSLHSTKGFTQETLIYLEKIRRLRTFKDSF